MNYIIKKILDSKEKETISRKILDDLPEWFGLSESTEEYIKKSQEMPFLACFNKDKAIGFIVLKETSKDTSEIFVMGVLKDYHRKGIGKTLYWEYENMAKEMDYSYSQVKTVKMGHYKEYDITNNFYISMGYKELECFPEMRDEWNPCQIYVKYIGNYTK